MNFIYPSFLWALSLIAIPIVIHLLNLRKHQTVYFSNVNLLKRVRKETKRKSKLKQYLILACRILTITVLVFAFAKPYISKGTTEKQQANNIVGIYIDNSFSMNAEGTEGRTIESARERAYAIVNSSRPDTKFALLSNSLNDLQNRYYTKTEMLRLIADIEVDHNWVEMSAIQRRLLNMMDNFLFETNKTGYFISDFQKHSTDIENFQPDSSITYHFVPVQANNVSNLHIDSCWFDAPTHHLNQTEVLNAKIVNSSDQSYYQIPVNLFVNDTLRSLASIDLEAGEQKIVTLQYTNNTSGTQLGRVEITDYPITYDNTIYFSYQVKEELNAIMIQQVENRTSRNIKALFMNDGYIKLDTDRADRLQISTLENYAAIFLNELRNISTGLSDELAKFAQNGGTLIIIPDKNIDVDSYNYLFSKLQTSTVSAPDTITIPIGEVNFSHRLYNEVFKEDHQKVALPDIKWRYRFNSNQQQTENTILSFPDQTKALWEVNIENGTLFVFAFPFSPIENHFVNHLLFLPTTYNMILQSAINQQLYNTIGIEKAFNLKFNNETRTSNIYLKNTQSGIELIPNIIQNRGNTMRLSVNGGLEAGFYHVYAENEKVSSIAFNYMLKESDLDFYNGETLLKLAKNAQVSNISIIETSANNMVNAIEEIEKGIHFWRLLILLALVFLITEAAIIRFWK